MTATLCEPLEQTAERPATATQVLFVAQPCRPQRKPILPLQEDGTRHEEREGHVTFVAPTRRGSFRLVRRQMSLLNYNFNRLFVAAKNHGREYPAEPLTHFGMQHDDIVPHAAWADTLIDEMETFGADVCSAVVPIKDARGLTSTALRNVATGETRRLTVTEVLQLPLTFGREDVLASGIDVHGRDRDKILAVNTGLWVCAWDRPWVRSFRGFHDANDIRECADGTFKAVCLSEDWLWSEWATRQGVTFCASRAVPLAHVDDDGVEYRNDHVWGTWATDQGDDEPQ